MIQSAMMFALGVFVTGLFALGFSVALAKRTRRVTERRILADIASRRVEFEAERDEMRARHAIQMHRLEREVARVLDMATAHRLDADVKDRDVLNAQAEMQVRDDEIHELHERLDELRATMQELERKAAESSASMRAARHALKLESRRRAAIENTFDQVLAVADEKQLELTTVQAQLEALRQAGPAAGEDGALSDTEAAGSVVPLPLRRQATLDADLDGADGEGVPAAAQLPDVRQGETAAVRTPRRGWRGHVRDEAAAETLFVEALAKIRALKRAAQAAE